MRSRPPAIIRAMGFYESILRPTLFKLDPEKAHELAMTYIAKGVLKARPFVSDRLKQTLFGVEFSNPLGLAAGFDKNAVAVDYWHQFGFGFVEVGTVTKLAQPGNPKPRLFRLPPDSALINRMGFNNDGSAAVAARLERSHSQIPLGINLGKSKVTPIEEAADDYAVSFRLLHNHGQYFVINVSSPNTPGLRTLQEKGPLLEIIAKMRAIDTAKPLFIKVAPDLEIDALDEVIQVAVESNCTGLIATNTTISREGLSTKIDEAGGLSGKPVKGMAEAFMAHLFKSCPKEMILVGVGGIFSGDDIYMRIALGAHLTQIYTGWIYGGPHCVPEMLAVLDARLARENIKNVAELRGTAHR